ncbi:MAG TPA: hypothetical protein VM261_35775 [Kofleriaceae bacterium]|nr:hypothetical protein [Kofleriaceae bacterium]
MGWLAGFAGLLALTVRAIRRARKDPRAIVARATVLIYAVLVGALGVSAAWVWGGAFAHDGRDRIAAGGGAQASAPARARLFVRAVQLTVGATPAKVGYSPAADLRLPRRYNLEEAQRGWDLLQISVDGPQGLRVAAVARPELTSTQVALSAHPRAADALLPVTEDIVADSRSAVGRRWCRDHLARSRLAAAGFDKVAARGALGGGAVHLDGAGVVVAVFCRDGLIVSALAFERDLATAHAHAKDAPAAAVGVRVTPLRAGARGLEAEHTEIAAGTLLQIGALADAVPGITLWEVPAPAGRAELFFPPPDVLAPCSEWLSRRGPILPTMPESTTPRERVESGDIGASCILPFSPPYAFEVRRLVPDVDGTDARSLWAGLILVGPALVFLLVLGARVRSELTRPRVARGLALAWLSSLFAALGVWRLLWAHRLDMMREYESIGDRVAGNQLLVLLGAAALAAAAVMLAYDANGRGNPRALAMGALAWVVAVVAGGHAMRGQLALVHDTRGTFMMFAQALLSLGLGLGTGVAAFVAKPTPPFGRVRDGVARVLRGPSERVLAAALAVAAVGFAGATFAKTAVILKLPLACATVGLVYLVARDALAGRSGALPVRIGAAVAVAAAVLATVVYDIGVGVALLGPGLPIAFLLAGHDACLAPDARGKLGTFDRQHAPLVRAHAAVLAAVAVAIIVWSSRTHADLGPAMTRGAMAAPIVFTVLVIVFGALWSRTSDEALESGHRRFVIVMCGLLAVLAIALTLLQGPLLEAFTDSESRHASRLSGVLDPGYALLRDDRDFLAGLAAWRETIVPEGAGAWPTGQGYFGAQVVDRGVWQSIENDYLPVLFVRETGALGLVAVAMLLVTAALGMWMIAGERFAHGSVAHRGRALAAAVLGALCVYQPLASLGVLPLTGISWPGLGLDSPTDFWLLFGIAAWIVLGGRDAAPGDAVPDPDASMRTGKGYVGVRRLALGVAALVAIAGVTLVARAARFALERPDPVDGAGDVARGFEGLGHAADYAQRLQCKDEEVESNDAGALVPAMLLGEPVDDMSRRFHRQLRDRWNADRNDAVGELRRFLADPRGRTTCTGDEGRWRFARGDDEGVPTCTAKWSFGWPEVTLDVRPSDSRADKATADNASPTAVATCDVALPGGALGALRRQDRRPFRGQRVRLVARPMGVAAGDRGELVAGHVTVRLRPGAGEVDVSRAQAGVFAAEKVRLADDLTVEIARDGGTLEARGTVWTFEKLPPRKLVQVLEADPSGWKLTAPASAGAAVPLPLESIAVLVIGGRESRNLWLYRPPRKWGGEDAGVDMLLADDVRTLGAARRRHYVLGGDLPELGWSSIDPSMSLGLDGWVQVALDRIEQKPTAAADRGAGLCGTLRPPTAPIAETPPDAKRMLDVGLNANVCARSTYDGVIECRLSLQPELTIALRHLTELIAAKPAEWLTLDGVAADKSVPATEGQFMLLRGDTGEIVAQGEFVPGRASSAFAPATPEIEQYLMRVLENRDPRTGAQLPTIEEDSSEKVEWNAPIAVGSTLKPLMARAFEMAAPDDLARLVMGATPQHLCPSGAHSILGHCPPTELWRASEPTFDVDVHRFLSESSNWFMAAIGILGTSLPGGELKMGDQSLSFEEVTRRDLGGAPDPIETSFDGASVITSRKVILASLRRTALWRRFEALVGRELCVDGAEACAKQIRGDVCAARALPITRPSSRLRRLVGLGPDRFEIYGEEPRPADVPVREYFQFLRGSGKHSIGSLAQLTDAFGRVVYDPATDGTFRLAASWFPVPAAGVAPEPCSVGHDRTVRGAAGGLCGVFQPRGTAARAMRPLLDDPRIILYGAKSGTIDSLGDVAEDLEKCERNNKRRTIAGRPLTLEHQPYWLQCGKPVPDDSLFLVAFGVKTDRGIERFTLGLRFERTGRSAATVAARHYIAAIAAYITGAWSSPAAPASTTTPASKTASASSSTSSPASPSSPSR